VLEIPTLTFNYDCDQLNDFLHFTFTPLSSTPGTVLSATSQSDPSCSRTGTFATSEPTPSHTQYDSVPLRSGLLISMIYWRFLPTKYTQAHDRAGVSKTHIFSGARNFWRATGNPQGKSAARGYRNCQEPGMTVQGFAPSTTPSRRTGCEQGRQRRRTGQGECARTMPFAHGWCVCVLLCVFVCVCFVCVCVCVCVCYSSIPGSRNWQVETADWIWPVSSSVL